ncbi:hypothetical protein [Algoriphagus zhangzhouensis]|uniref:WD40-like Beta Propeller Repeat n=1 Tax=Algoriphagus zhangzhouensis TaxID=1073327 RepID=A0A1M7ZEA9_9BACT|nr:hypothetical protein [Algoriphagus zhangzhouensis]TDY45866.1 hypothetical protein A8938_2470 [Algoriphagus zhangzhouensis]SHO63016.1 hypothetical protein SAMN04488108_2467 [Algoriphagus zhangzhouensis]
MNKKLTVLLFLITFSAASAQDFPISTEYFEEGVPQNTIKNPILEEISGIAFSRIHPNLIYAQTDSGGEPAVYLLDSLGNELGKIILKGVKNRDWEDIAVAEGPDGKCYIYVAEIGDNAAVHPSIFIYKIPEPTTLSILSEVKPEILELEYPGGARDAETLIVDAQDEKIYILSKRDKKNNLYSVDWDKFGKDKAIELNKEIELPITSSVGGDISSQADQILIKNYLAIYYWKRANGQSIVEALEENPISLPYVPEPQGESIAFSPSSKSFFTLSEKRFNINPVLYRYSSKY